MKKLFFLLLLSLFFTIFLCSCSETALEQSGGTSESSLSSSSLPKLPHAGVSESSSDISMGIPDPPIPINKRIYQDFNGKYGLLDKDANILVEPIYDKAEMFDDFFIFSLNGDDGKSWATVVNYSGEQIGPEIGPGYESTELVEKNETGAYFAASIANGTRLRRVVTDDRQRYTEEEPNIEYWILNSKGEPVFDISFDQYIFIYPGMTPEDAFGFCAEKDGDYYQYGWNDKSYELELKELKGETGEEFFGYKQTRYYWEYSSTFPGYGLNSSDGSVLFEPIYFRLFMPFNDRVILTYNNYSDILEGEGLHTLVDLDGNVYASWNRISYTIFEDGSYIGVATSNGEEIRESEATRLKCYDENGNVRPRGWWFVDKDGKTISERFEEIYFMTEDYRENFHPSSPYNADDPVVAVTESGETITFSIDKYLCES